MRSMSTNKTRTIVTSAAALAVTAGLAVRSHPERRPDPDRAVPGQARLLRHRLLPRHYLEDQRPGE